MKEMNKADIYIFRGALAAAGAYLSGKLGALFPVLCLFTAAMAIDYITGMLASKVEAIKYPLDPAYGWNSKKGAIGIIKKVSCLCVIAVSMIVDYILVLASRELDFQMPVTAFFSLLVAVWYLLNELLSIIENAGRMGANVPEWLKRYIAVLRDKIDSRVE